MTIKEENLDNELNDDDLARFVGVKRLEKDRAQRLKQANELHTEYVEKLKSIRCTLVATVVPQQQSQNANPLVLVFTPQLQIVAQE